MKRGSIYKLLLGLLLPAITFGQSTLPEGAPKPTANIQNATGGVSGKTMSVGNIHSPSLFDGSQNISIPFYSFSNDYGSYGVSVNYNTKGVLVTEKATMTGLHFNLSAGGSLQRSVKDLPDEMYGKSNTSTTPYPLNVFGKLSASLNASAPTTGWYKDKEHDDYMVSVPGLSFTFNIGKNGYIFTHPNTYAKIELLHNGLLIDSIPAHDSLFDFGFRITDDKGVVYYFGNAATDWLEVKRTGSGVQKTNIQYIAKWDLVKIEFPDDNKIEYEWGDQYIPPVDYFTNTSREILGASKDMSLVAGMSGMTDNTISRLNRIRYPNGNAVEFIYSTEPRCDGGGWLLDKILVKGGTTQRVYDLYYHYRYSTGMIKYEDDSCVALLPGMDCRLYLNNIFMEGTDGVSWYNEDYYTFEYDSVNLPYRQWGGKDFFGYYNGENYNMTPFGNSFTIPQHTNLLDASDNYGVPRTYNPVYAKAGLLRSYTNGFGGKVTFEYEGHSSLTNPLTGLPTSPALLGQNAMDGVRVKRIIRTDHYSPGTQDITEYEYAGGQRFFPGGYFHTPDARVSGVIRAYYYMGDFVTPFHLVNGSNHGYSTVTETRKNELGQVLGKQVTTFTNFSDASSGGVPRYLRVGGQKHYWEYPYADRQYIKDWEMGLPLEIVQYDMNGFITSRVINQYQFTLDTTATIGKVDNMKMMYIKPAMTGEPTQPFDSVAYRPYTGRALLQRTVTQQYHSNTAFVADTVLFDYDSRQNLVKTTTRNSKGRQTSLEYLYNYNVTGTLPASLTAFPAHLALNLGMERWLLPVTSGGTGSLLSASLNRYEYNAGKIRLKAVYAAELGDPLPDATYAGANYGTPTFLSNRYNALRQVYNDITPANFKELSRSVLHDAKGNVLTTELLDENIFTANIWDTAAGTRLAEVSHASYAEIAFAGFDQLLPGIYGPADVIQSGNFSYPSHGMIAAGICGKAYKLQTSYNSFLTSVSLTPGKKYVIQFWYKGTLPLVSGAGIGVPTFKEQYAVGAWKNVLAVITPTSTGAITIKRNTADVDIDEVRLYPEESEMTTYTYDPMNGIRAAADARGRLIFTEYDHMGRVRLVRDQEGNILSQNEYGTY